MLRRWRHGEEMMMASPSRGGDADGIIEEAAKEVRQSGAPRRACRAV
jgi:hypothetical protein